MRTYNEIYQSIVDKKNSTEELDDLNSISQTAVWRLLAHLTVTAIYIFEGIFYTEKAGLESQLLRNKYGFIDWYSNEAEKFQYGDSLVFDDDSGTYFYEHVDDSKLIIARASASENPITAQISLKVAKDNGGSLIKLTAVELTAFTAYMQAVKVAGTNLLIISDEADIITINGLVKFNSQYSELDVKSAISTALSDFKLSFSYNGILRKNDIIQAIRDVAGVVDFIPSVLSGQSIGAGAVTIIDDYETYSGYFNYSVVDPENNFNYEAI